MVVDGIGGLEEDSADAAADACGGGGGGTVDLVLTNGRRVKIVVVVGAPEN